MNFGNVFENILPSALLWFCFNVLPAPILLFIKIGQRRELTTLIFKPAFKVLLAFSLLHHFEILYQAEGLD
jgi:hypothetical protein